MGFFKYPYTDLNELNLDWVIEKIKYIEQASHIIYDNTGSGLAADNVQSALDEIVGIIQTTGVTSWNTRVGDVVPQAGDYTAAQVTYDGSGSGLLATNVQGAIDEVKGDIPTTAADVPYNNSVSGLSATDVQDAIDEISSSAGVSSFNTRTGAVVATSGDYNAGQVTYDNTVSGLTATDTQAAIDELAAAPGGVTSFNNRTGAVVPAASDYAAAQVDFDDTVAQTGSSNVQGALQYVATRGASAQYTTYDNTQSGLTATNVQAAIDEVANDVLSSGVASFNGRTGAVNPQSGDYDLTELGDVAISSPTNDQVLKYDSVSQKWINGAGGGGGSSTLAGLSDVTLTTPAAGDQLTYDGADWVNTPSPSIPSDLDDLSDVTITTPQTYDVLKYDGAGWVNAPAGYTILEQVTFTNSANDTWRNKLNNLGTQAFAYVQALGNDEALMVAHIEHGSSGKYGCESPWKLCYNTDTQFVFDFLNTYFQAALIRSEYWFRISTTNANNYMFSCTLRTNPSIGIDDRSASSTSDTLKLVTLKLKKI